MHAQVRFLGHPIHQMIIAFPLGLLGMAGIFDIIWLITQNPNLATSSCWMIGAGVIAGLIAAVFGLIDWLGIPRRTRAKTVGLLHGLSMVLAVVGYALSFILRFRDAAHPTNLAIWFSLCALVVACVGGWLGGELVDRLAIGVDEGAHADAPSSLSGRPAAEHVTHS